MMSSRDIPEKYHAKVDHLHIVELVRELFSILDAQEEKSTAQVPFHPTHITTCRVVDGIKLDILLPLLRDRVK